MTDNEIIKALAGCSIKNNCSTDCPYRPYLENGCSEAICGDALELIMRQQAEIERLNSCVMSEEQVREIMKSQMHTVFKDIIEDATDKAIKEFTEKLKLKRGLRGELWNSDIDNLVKEKVGADDG